MAMARGRAYTRDCRRKKIQSKKNFLKLTRNVRPPHEFQASDMFWRDFPYDISYGNCLPYWNVKADGMLSKGKIHCSCPLCSFHGTTIQDKRVALKMEYDLKDAEDYIPGHVAQRIERVIKDREY